MKTTILTALVSAASLAIGANAFAAGQKHSDPSNAPEMESESVSAYGAEESAYESSFDNIDQNGDGYISEAEMHEHMEAIQAYYQRLEKDRAEADKNADGQWDQSEFSALERTGGFPARP